MQNVTSQAIVVQNAPDRKQRTLEPPVLSLRTLETYAPLRAEGSESVPAVVCAFCATSLAETYTSVFAILYFNPVKMATFLKMEKR